MTMVQSRYSGPDIRAAIDRYEAGADEPRRAVAGLTREELNAHPVPGTWSIQEIVLHLMDSDLIASDRMKRVIAEPRPLIIGYDESAFARALAYDRIDAWAACDLFALNRRVTTAMLRAQPPEAFSRDGVHNQHGLRSLYDFVKGYGDHLEHHMKFAMEKRRLLGR
jgi:hypothetical protein